jgi:hypothetical protein
MIFRSFVHQHVVFRDVGTRRFATLPGRPTRALEDPPEHVPG